MTAKVALDRFMEFPDSNDRVGRAPQRPDILSEYARNGVRPALAGSLANTGVHIGPERSLERSPLVPEQHRQILDCVSSRPIAIPGSPSRSRSRVRYSDLDSDALQNNASETLTGRARRRKKKAMKKRQADLLAQATRSSSATPSGDEDSDFDKGYFKRIDISARASVTSSPMLNATGSSTPVVGGISALRRQLSTIELGASAAERPGAAPMVRMDSAQSVTSQSTIASGSGSDKDLPRVASYEVTLEQDFVSHEALFNEPPPTSEDAGKAVENVHRKMTAQDFEPITCLGKGTFGTVHMVRQKATGRLYAQKMFRKASLTVRKTLVEQTKTERAILESVSRHPFVVKLYYAFQDNERLYLILEYAQGGELFHHLHKEGMFTEEVASFYMAELVLALEHLHVTVGVIYRDLKPENCLLDVEGHLLLTDFGLSKVALDDSDRSNSVLGTLEYMAPEVINGQMYGREVDWWSLGALGCDLLTGNPPFTANNYAKIQEKIVKSKLQLPYFLGPDAKDLLTRLLRKEPNKRLGARMPKDMQTIKAHRFFRKLSWKQLERRELEPPIRPLVTDPLLAENFSEEFTSLALSFHQTDDNTAWEDECVDDTFGGFTYVASPTLLKGNLW